MSLLTEDMIIPRRRLLAVALPMGENISFESKLRKRRLREYTEKWEKWSRNPKNIINHNEQGIARLEKFVVSS